MCGFSISVCWWIQTFITPVAIFGSALFAMIGVRAQLKENRNNTEKQLRDNKDNLDTQLSHSDWQQLELVKLKTCLDFNTSVSKWMTGLVDSEFRGDLLDPDSFMKFDYSFEYEAIHAHLNLKMLLGESEVTNLSNTIVQNLQELQIEVRRGEVDKELFSNNIDGIIKLSDSFQGEVRESVSIFP